jgi:hypothetical protein
MTDGLWALLAPLLPAAGSTGGRGGGPCRIYAALRERARLADGRGPATHEAMIWTAATWQLSNRLTR